MPLLQLCNIAKSFGTHNVLSGISLSIDGGQIVGLLGGNGSGKTTLLRIATRIIQPDAGEVLFDDHPISLSDLRRVGYLPEERGLYRHAAAGPQAAYLARLKGLSKAEAEQVVRSWFESLGIAHCWHTPVARLSKGMQQKVQFIATVAHSPALLVLDEPFSGFDTANADLLAATIQSLANDGTAVLISTHHPRAIALCHKTLTL